MRLITLFLGPEKLYAPRYCSLMVLRGSMGLITLPGYTGWYTGLYTPGVYREHAGLYTPGYTAGRHAGLYPSLYTQGGMLELCTGRILGRSMLGYVWREVYLMEEVNSAQTM